MYSSILLGHKRTKVFIGIKRYAICDMQSFQIIVVENKNTKKIHFPLGCSGVEIWNVESTTQLVKHRPWLSAKVVIKHCMPSSLLRAERKPWLLHRVWYHLSNCLFSSSSYYSLLSPCFITPVCQTLWNIPTRTFLPLHTVAIIRWVDSLSWQQRWKPRILKLGYISLPKRVRPKQTC